MDTQHKISTVKLFKPYSGDVTCTPDSIAIKEPKFWTFNTDQMEWKSMDKKKRTSWIHMGQKTVQKKNCMNTVPIGKKCHQKEIGNLFHQNKWLN